MGRQEARGTEEGAHACVVSHENWLGVVSVCTMQAGYGEVYSAIEIPTSNIDFRHMVLVYSRDGKYRFIFV